MVNVQGEALQEEEKSLLKKHRIGGVILFRKNIKSFKQVYELCLEIKSLTSPSPWIAIDMEGGEVNRFSHLPEAWPWPSALKLRENSIQDIGEIARLLAQELRLLGIDINLAPVVDLPEVSSSLLKTRTFGLNPKDIIQKAGAFVQGLKQAHVLACLKHFPSHGGVQEDSHSTLPQDSRTLKDLQAQFQIFQNLFQAHEVFIMTAHIQFPQVDSLPATFSSRFLREELQSRLKFSGLIVSDDIDMLALSEFSPVERVRQALQGGCHLILSCQKKETYQDILENFKEDKEITPYIQQASDKIFKLKQARKSDKLPWSFVQSQLPSLQGKPFWEK